METDLKSWILQMTAQRLKHALNFENEIFVCLEFENGYMGMQEVRRRDGYYSRVDFQWHGNAEPAVSCFLKSDLAVVKELWSKVAGEKYIFSIRIVV